MLRRHFEKKSEKKNGVARKRLGVFAHAVSASLLRQIYRSVINKPTMTLHCMPYLKMTDYEIYNDLNIAIYTIPGVQIKLSIITPYMFSQL